MEFKFYQKALVPNSKHKFPELIPLNSFRLLVFIKNEKPGYVKTRLASSIGKQEALRAYQLLLKYTKEQISELSYYKEIWYSEFIEKNDIWSEGGFSKKLQKGINLGERMRHAFENAFIEGNSDRVVLIGSDCAELTGDIIKTAFEVLQEKDVVIGPAYDGGYYLIGMKRFIPELFDSIPWSTPEVFYRTTQVLEGRKTSYGLLQQLSDVDEAEDWDKVKDRLNRL